MREGETPPLHRGKVFHCRGAFHMLPRVNRIYQNKHSTCHPEPWKKIGKTVHKEVEGSFREAEFLLLWWENRRPTKTSVSPSARILRMFLYKYQYRSPTQDDTLNFLFGSRSCSRADTRSVSLHWQFCFAKIASAPTRVTRCFPQGRTHVSSRVSTAYTKTSNQPVILSRGRRLGKRYTKRSKDLSA